MKTLKLTKEEKNVILADEKGLLKNASNLKELKSRYAKIAKNTLKKNKSITIRLAERDLQRIKAKAAEEGVPYQTLITSILHKNVK
jgi:predicted DNA binding CopG/RHH family protein